MLLFELPVLSKYSRQNQNNTSNALAVDMSKLGIKFAVMFSGGKDSIAMVLHLLEIGVAKDLIELHHHDVDGHAKELFDWSCTPAYCQAFADAFGLPLYFSYREGGIKREILRTAEGLQDVMYQRKPKGEFFRLISQEPRKTIGWENRNTRHKFPAVAASLMTRWCSAVVKIDVMKRVISNSPNLKDSRFVLCTGERREESSNRSKYHEWSFSPRSTKSRKVVEWRPIIDWNEGEIWEIIEKHRVQPHPCYELGWSRCSCQTCIFSSPNTWASINEISPEKIDEISSLEIKIGHTVYNKSTIRQKVSKGKSFIKEENRSWIQHALSKEWTLPIILNTWKLPQGAKSKEASGSV